MGVDMPTSAFAASLIRIGTFTAELERLHLWGTDDDIDREFNAVCRTIWGYSLDDFDDDCLAKADHDWLDELTARRAYRFAAENGYDLGDYSNGEMVSDWWGFIWMIVNRNRNAMSAPSPRYVRFSAVAITSRTRRHVAKVPFPGFRAAQVSDSPRK